MNYPAASGEVSLKALNRPKGRGIKPELRNKWSIGKPQLLAITAIELTFDVDEKFKSAIANGINEKVTRKKLKMNIAGLISLFSIGMGETIK